MYQIGILGAAGIAPRAVIQPARRRTDVAVHAVASRRSDAAKAYAETHGIPVAYSSYDEMLEDADLDVVYVALPPAGHAEWTIKALRAGKHVLCEKPLAMNAAEARLVVEAEKASGKIMMEAFHSRYHPAFLHLLALRDSGRLGTIKSIRAEFFVDIPFRPSSIRHDPGQGGGAMMDLGCYPLHWLRTLTGEEPEILSAEGEKTQLGVDQSMEARLVFPSGVAGHLIVDIANPPFRGMIHIECEHGIVELDNPLMPHRGHSLREWLDSTFVEHTIAAKTSYDYQLAALVDALDTSTPPLTGGTDSVANMTALDAIYRKGGFLRPS